MSKSQCGIPVYAIDTVMRRLVGSHANGLSHAAHRAADSIDATRSAIELAQ